MTSTRYQIVLIKPADFGPAEPFREVMEYVQLGLAGNGYDAPMRENVIAPGAIPIVFGAHYLTRENALRLPPDTIIYNLEQLAPGYPWFQSFYLELLSRFRVWDYDAANVTYLRSRGICHDVAHVPIGYAPCWVRVPAALHQDVDVLFYGIQTPRRLHVLQALGKAGLHVIALNNIWGEERDRWISRSKVVLSMHQADTGKFELARVIFLLANGKAAVCETADIRNIDPSFAGALVPCRYDELVESCLVVARSAGLRRHLGEAGPAALRAPHLQAPRIIADALVSADTSGEAA